MFYLLEIRSVWQGRNKEILDLTLLISYWELFRLLLLLDYLEGVNTLLFDEFKLWCLGEVAICIYLSDWGTESAY